MQPASASTHEGRSGSVYLTTVEKVLADVAGWMRTVISRRQGLADDGYYNVAKSVIANDQLGVAGEMGFAKWKGVYYDFPVGTFKAPDVAGFQVRATDHRHGGLIVRHGASPADNFLLVIVEKAAGGALQCRVVGWIGGREAMTTTYKWRDNWKVPQEFLNEVTR